MEPHPIFLDDALTGVSRLALDTPPLIYLVEQDAIRLPVVREIFRRVDAGELTAHASVIILTEVLTAPRRMGTLGIEQQYQDVLTNGRNFYLIPVDISVADRAAHLRARYGLQTPDAIVAATAIEGGCDALLTNDRGLLRVVEVRVLLVDDITI